MGRAIQTYRKIFDTLKQDRIERVYFLFGPEEFLKKEFVRGLIEKAVPGTNRAFNLDILYGDEFDRAAFDDRVNSFPLFTERRVVILKKFDSLTLSHKDHVIDSVANVSDSLVLVIESAAEKPDNARLRKLKAAADKVGMSAPFLHLDEQETIERVTGRLRREGLSITPDALDLLVDSVGTHLIDLSNEVDKMLLALGDGDTVDADLVSRVVGRYRVESMFALLDEVGRRNPGSTIRTLNKLVDGGEEPVFLLAMLLKRVVLLMEVKAILAEKGRSMADPALADYMSTGVSPFYARKLRQQAEGLESEALDVMLTNLRWADVKLKTSALPARSVLEEALLASHVRKSLVTQAL